MEIDGINYELREDGTAIVLASENKCGYSGHVSIPETVTFLGKEYPIVRLDAYCFCESDVEFCTIPNGKYKIEIWDCVFLRCPKLKEIVIPDSVTVIGEAAFCDCTALDSVKIGKSVAEIGDNAFRNCTSLTSIVVDAENPTYDSRNNCNAIIETKSKTLICGKDTTIIPEGIVRIGYAAFDGCNFTSITIPNSVRKIEEIALNNCTKLASVVIPQGVTSIGAAAFGNCESLTSVTIPDALTHIAESAFENCKSLISITIPNGVTTIGKEAFSGCSCLTSISIPDSVTKIEERAFAGCQSLTSVKIGKSVAEIGDNAFRNCTSLTSIVVNAENTTYDSRNNCNAIIETKSKTLIYGRDTAIIPEGIVRIGYAAFEGCNFTSITIPNSVLKIEKIAFYNCTELNSVIIPQGVTSIDASAFCNCESLISVNIPDTLTYIAECAFKNCKSLTSITIPNSVITIGKEAFNGCSCLTSIRIPDSVTKIEERAFAGCQSLTTVRIGNIPTIISGDVFNDCPNIDIALVSVWIGGFTPIIIERYNLDDDIRTLTPYKICRYVRKNWGELDSEIVDSYVDGRYFLPSDLEVYINDEECEDYPWDNIGKDYVFDKEQVYGIMSSDYTTYAATLILPLDTKFEPRRLYIDSIYYVRYYTGDEIYFKRHKWYKGNRKAEIVVPLRETSNPDCYPELIVVKGYAYKF